MSMWWSRGIWKTGFCLGFNEAYLFTIGSASN